MEDSHKLVYDKIVKRHKSTNSVHTVRLIFYLLDISLLIMNIVVHSLNGAYVALTLTIVIHFVSTGILALLYDANGTEIDEGNITIDTNQRSWVNLREISKWLGFTPLFRIIVSWKDHGEMHNHIRMQQKLRKNVVPDEVRKAILIRKRLLVNAYFDTIHAHFKTIPQSLLQIFIALDLNLPLRFCGITDLTRFVTMAGSVIMAARTSASYTSELSDYLKLLQIQDILEYQRKSEPIRMPSTHLWWISFLVNIIVVATRVYAIAFIMDSSRLATHIPPFMVAAIFVLNLIWIRVNPESRPLYENPPRGLLTIQSEIFDRFMNVFSIHTVVGSVKTMLFHQAVFVSTFYAFVGGIHIITLQEQSYWNWSRTISTVDIVNCNFSTFSDSRNNLARALHLILNEYGDRVPMFGEIFSVTACTILLSLSLVVTLCNVVYLKIYKLKECHFPLHVSIKSWQRFLDRDWNGVGKVAAIKTLLLGVLESNVLEYCNYKFPEDIVSLKGLMQGVIEKHKLAKPPLEKFPAKFNPCQQQLENLKNYLFDIEETQPLCEYFINYFDTCMGQMTSYRIAQTSNIILDTNPVSELFFRNFKYFGLRL